jgi:hypothetical protein
LKHTKQLFCKLQNITSKFHIFLKFLIHWVTFIIMMSASNEGPQYSL